MGTEELILLIAIYLTIITSVGIVFIFLAVRKIIAYYNQKTIIDYKSYITSMGIKHYVDDTLDEYITDALEEIVTTDPKYIGAETINSENEKDLLQKVTNQVVTFLPESFAEQMRKVYNIDIMVDNVPGMIDIITRKTYLKIMTLAVKANSMKDQEMNINQIINEDL